MMSDNTESNENVVIEADQPGQSLKQNICNGSTWLRLFFMLVIFCLYGVSRAVVAAVVVVQFFWVLFSGETNEKLRHFGDQLARYTLQVIRYLTFNSEERPYPFDLEWPNGSE